MPSTIGLPSPSTVVVTIQVGNADSNEVPLGILSLAEVDNSVGVGGTTLRLRRQTEPPDLDAKGSNLVTQGAIIPDDAADADTQVSRAADNGAEKGRKIFGEFNLVARPAGHSACGNPQRGRSLNLLN
jgi:hypothetical protein